MLTRVQPTIAHRAIHVRGIVQGVGFRPFVYRLASELKLDGWVCNDADGVTIEVHGPADALPPGCVGHRVGGRPDVN